METIRETVETKWVTWDYLRRYCRDRWGVQGPLLDERVLAWVESLPKMDDPETGRTLFGIETRRTVVRTSR